MGLDRPLWTTVAKVFDVLTDPELRLKDQERDGVQAEVLYGILGREPCGSMTMKLLPRCLRIYKPLAR